MLKIFAFIFQGVYGFSMGLSGVAFSIGTSVLSPIPHSDTSSLLTNIE